MKYKEGSLQAVVKLLVTKIFGESRAKQQILRKLPKEAVQDNIPLRMVKENEKYMSIISTGMMN